MKHRRTLTFIIVFLSLFATLLACSQTQPNSQERQLQATISSLQTQVAAGHSSQPSPPTVTSVQSQEQQLQATIAALQAQVGQPPSEPTAISTPSPTLFQDTVPGTILDVGQSWYQNGLKLELRSADIHPEGIPLEFYLTSFKPQNIIIQYDLAEALSAVDNLGRNLEIVEDRRLISGGPSYHMSFTEKLIYGQPLLLKIYVCCFGADVLPFVLVNPADLNLTEVIVTINIHTIRNARWRIEIPH